MTNFLKPLSVLLALVLALGFISYTPVEAVTESQDTIAWSFNTQNNYTNYYKDYNENYEDPSCSYPTNYSLAMEIAQNEQAYYTKSISVSKNTDYVINVMVKSTTLNSNGILPFSITANIGSTSVSSKNTPGTENQWKEVSLGFNSGNYTNITIKLSSSQAGTVWLDNISVDTISKMKVLCVSYAEMNATVDGYNYKAQRKTIYNQISPTQLCRDFDAKMNELSNGKIVTETQYESINTLRSITTYDTLYNVEFADIKSDIQQYITNNQYDLVICIFPTDLPGYEINANTNGRDKYPGQYHGIYNTSGNLINDSFDSIDESFGYLTVIDNTFQNYYDEGAFGLEGMIHETIHHFENFATREGAVGKIDWSTLDYEYNKVLMDYYDNNYFDTGYTNNEKRLIRNNTQYINYGEYYNATFKATKNSTSPDNQYFPRKYQWYSDVLNNNVPDYNTANGYFGMRSKWLYKSDTQITYHMNVTCGVKQGVYNLQNKNSSKFIQSSGTQAKQYLANNNIDQMWEFIFKNGFYEIAPVSDRTKRLTISGTSNGQDITMISSNNSDAQLWRVLSLSNGYFQLFPKSNLSSVLEIEGPSISEGAVAQIWTLNETGTTNNNSWAIATTKTIDEGIYNFKNNNTSKYMCSVNSVKQYSKNYNINQLWEVKYINGYYQFIPLTDSSKRLTILSTNNGSDTALSTSSTVDTQLWLVIMLSDGTYRISPKSAPGKALEIEGPSISDGAVIQIWDFSQSNAYHKWKIESDSTASGVYTLKSRFSNKYLDSRGDNVTQYTSNAKTQLWEFKYNNGFYEIIPLTNQTKRLTASTSSSNATSVSQDIKNNSDNQKWALVYQSDGSFMIVPKCNITKGLEIAGPTSLDGRNAQLWDHHAGNQIKWDIQCYEPADEGNFKIKNSHSSLYLDIMDGKIVQRTSSNNLTQKWRLQYDNGRCMIVSLSDSTKCLTYIDLCSGSREFGLAPITGSENQYWTVVLLDNNVYQISPKKNHHYAIEIQGNSTANNAPVQLWTMHGGNSIRWTFESA